MNYLFDYYHSLYLSLVVSILRINGLFSHDRFVTVGDDLAVLND